MLFSKVTKQDKELFDSVSDIQLADWHCELNSWGCPDEINADELGYEYQPNGRRKQLMDEIERRVGLKLISRRWNKERMTDDEHEEFWHSNKNLLVAIAT